MNEVIEDQGSSVDREALDDRGRTALAARFSPREVEYVARVLTRGELAVIADLGDALILARIKRMSGRRLRRFERLAPARPEDHHLYAALQLDWLRHEQYLLSTRLGRGPTHRELFADFMRNHNGLRFRAYFAMKYPHRVRQLTGGRFAPRDAAGFHPAVLS